MVDLCFRIDSWISILQKIFSLSSKKWRTFKNHTRYPLWVSLEICFQDKNAWFRTSSRKKITSHLNMKLFRRIQRFIKEVVIKIKKEGIIVSYFINIHIIIWFYYVFHVAKRFLRVLVRHEIMLMLLGALVFLRHAIKCFARSFFSCSSFKCSYHYIYYRFGFLVDI